MFKSINSLFFLLFSTNFAFANGDIDTSHLLSQHLSNSLSNTIISDANLHQSDIKISSSQISNIEIKSTNTLLNSIIKNGSNVFQNIVQIESSSVNNIVISNKNIIENSIIDNSTVSQGSIYIGNN
ncbi:hypothetical protein GSY74_06650 [Sulfurovum sp. bin170]|nr:hypothetical protein [Sulfurovum sp. bin170]